MVDLRLVRKLGPTALPEARMRLMMSSAEGSRVVQGQGIINMKRKVSKQQRVTVGSRERVEQRLRRSLYPTKTSRSDPASDGVASPIDRTLA